MRIFDPLPSDHSLVTDTVYCWICRRRFHKGQRTMLMEYQTPEQAGSRTVEAKPVHATCSLRGRKARNSAGVTVIIERVKDGDASPFPIETTDGSQWKVEELDLCP